MIQRTERLKVCGVKRGEGDGDPAEETDRASGGSAGH